MICDRCGNKSGFAFGICVQCGFDNHSKEFKIIKVHVDDLPAEIRSRLIAMHERRVRQFQ